LRESYAVIKKAAVVISNDSAPMHMAVAADVPVVAIFCSTVPEFGFAPKGENDIVLEAEQKLDCRPCGMHGHKSCPERHFHCGTWVTVERVMEEIWNRLPDFEHQSTIEI
jgi:heptosyltransferase-2